MDTIKWNAILRAKETVIANVQAHNPDWTVFTNEIQGLSSTDLLRVMTDALPLSGHSIYGAFIRICKATLDAQLVSEHIAAQEKMSQAAERLQKAGTYLAIAAAILALVGLFQGWIQISLATHGR